MTPPRPIPSHPITTPAPTPTQPHLLPSPSTPLAILTLVEDLEAAVGAAVVSGEEHVQVISGAEQELRDLAAVKGANQRRQQIGAVVQLQEIVIDLRLKSEATLKKKREMKGVLGGKECEGRE